MATFASFANANSVCASRGGGNCISNTAFGYGALSSNNTGYCNTAVGRLALNSNTSGNRNTAIGALALRCNVSGVCNTAVGAFAGCAMTGNNLTAVGYMAARNTTGDSNTMVGAFAGCNVTTGVSNVLIGAFAGCNMQGGSCNVGIGTRTLTGTTGAGNVAIGCGTSNNVTSGACNIAVGLRAGLNTTIRNCTIGFGENSNPSDTAGHTAWGNANLNYNGIAAGWTNVSDCRDKTNIEDLDPKLGLDFIRNLNTVSFNWDYRDRYVLRCGYEYGTKDGTLSSPKKSYGFIAQQMKQLTQDLGTAFEALRYNTEKDGYRLSYADMIAPLVKAVQQTSQRLETLEALAG